MAGTSPAMTIVGLSFMPFAPFHAVDRVATRLRDALTDPAHSERNVILALVAYVVLWTLYGTISKSSQGLHYDMTELIAWSRDLSFGYLKHPPLAAWIVALWFSVFSLAEWSYYLLAMLMPTVTLWFAWRLSADYLDVEKRVVGLALLMLVPFFNFHALKFNVNTVLMPAWAATTFWFLRSYKTRSGLYAALAGVGAAASMLGKYWSVFLLAGLFVAALIDRRRGRYFRSAAPWITVAAGLIVLVPHLVWLYRNDFAPFGYALGVHGARPFAVALQAVLGYFAGSLGYVAVPLIVVLAILRSSPRPAYARVASFGAFVVRRSAEREGGKREPRAENSDAGALDSRLRGNERSIGAIPSILADMAWPYERDRRLAALAFWAPFLLPALGALASGTEINSLWSMPAWTLLPVLLLSQSSLMVAVVDTRRILIAATALPLVVLLASPVIAIVAHRNGPPPAAAHAQLLAAEIERLWRDKTPMPLRFIDGDAGLAFSVVTYAGTQPRALPGLPRPGEAQLTRAGMALVCLAEDTGCVSAAALSAAAVAGGRTVERTIVRNYLTLLGEPQRYTIVIVPPRP
jgi:4-amino-4-deoxy-L-arabinose transferase-like glycosyltransferase